MRKRKMLRTTTLFISVLVVATLAISTYFLIYRNISAYNKQLEVMQKDLLINFQTKSDEILSNLTREISMWMLKDRAIQFASEEEHSYYNAQILYQDIIKESDLYYNLDCFYGIFRPDRDIFITNQGILHGDGLERYYGFAPGSVDLIKRLPEKEFVNNFYVADEFSVSQERINLIIKRNPTEDDDVAIYGIISLNLRQIAKQITQMEDGAFFAFKNENCFFSSDPDVRLEKMRRSDEESDLVYDLVYSIGMKKRSNFLLWSLYIILLLLLVAAGLYGSFFLARFLHRPVENILRQISDDETEIYDEEAYISSRFVEIKNVNRQLAERVNAQEESLKQNFVRDLLFGMVTEEAMVSKGELYGLKALRGDVSLAILEENNNEARGVVYLNQITSFLESKIENSMITFLNSGQVAVIAPDISYETFKNAILQAILQIDEGFDVSYTGSISTGTLSSLRELSNLFSNAMRYLQSGNFSYDKLIITKEDLLEQEEYGYYYPLELEKNIIGCVTNNDFERAMQMVRMILDKNLIEMKLSKGALTELKFAFVGTIKRILQALKKTESELFGEGSILYLELSACRTPEEVSKKIIEMFSSIRVTTEDAYDDANSALIDQLEAFIQENYYQEDMSLFFLAEQFNITSGYISRIFKKYRDINFKDYLSAYRIQKATEILEVTPDIRVADLAKRVGYDNVQRFVRNFKKLKNVSPGEYKKKK